jgi:hypothetical protein
VVVKTCIANVSEPSYFSLFSAAPSRFRAAAGTTTVRPTTRVKAKAKNAAFIAAGLMLFAEKGRKDRPFLRWVRGRIDVMWTVAWVLLETDSQGKPSCLYHELWTLEFVDA